MLKSIGTVPAHPGVRASSPFGAYYLPATIAGGTSTSVVVANTLYYLPHYLPGARINRIGVEMTVGSAGAARLGIYTNNDGLPGALILDCGTVDTTGTGNVEATFAEITLPTAWVWAAIVFDATPTCRNGTTTNQHILGVPTGPSNTSRGLLAAFTYEALPAAAPAPTGASTVAPAVWFRRV